jgi:hypothetical protein
MEIELWEKVDKNNLPKGRVILPSLCGNTIMIGNLYLLNDGLVHCSGVKVGDHFTSTYSPVHTFCRIEKLLLLLD